MPFFFVVSGYFLAKGMSVGNEIARIKQFINRLLLPLLVFGSINTVLEIIKLRNSGAESIVKTVILHCVFYPYGALWYVTASIVGALLLIPFLKKNQLKTALVIGSLLFCWALLCNRYYFLAIQFPILRRIVDAYLKLFISARNGVFVGFFMLAIGVHIETLDVGKEKIKISTLIFYLLYVIEVFFTRKYPSVDDCSLYVMQLFFVPSLVVTLLQLPFTLPKNISKILRNLSTGIYFQHRVWLSVIRIISATSNCVITTCFSLVMSIGVCLIAILRDSKVLKKLLF